MAINTNSFKNNKIIVITLLLLTLIFWIITFNLTHPSRLNKLTNNDHISLQNKQITKINNWVNENKPIKKVTPIPTIKPILLNNDNVLVLFNNVYHSQNIFYKDIKKVWENISKLRYIKYIIKNKSIGTWNNKDMKIKEIKSKLYNCKLIKADNSIKCIWKKKITVKNINNNKLWDNLYLFSIIYEKVTKNNTK